MNECKTNGNCLWFFPLIVFGSFLPLFGNNFHNGEWKIEWRKKVECLSYWFYACFVVAFEDSRNGLLLFLLYNNVCIERRFCGLNAPTFTMFRFHFCCVWTHCALFSYDVVVVQRFGFRSSSSAIRVSVQWGRDGGGFCSGGSRGPPEYFPLFC